MKCLFIFIFLLSGLSITAQTSKPIPKVIIKYFNGHSSWGKLGVYSRGEIFEISAINDSTFKIKHHLKFTQTAVDSITFKKDTVEIRSKNYKRISKRVIDSLYVQLDTSKYNFNASFIGPKLLKPTKRQITRVANKRDKYFKDDNLYLDRVKDRHVIAKIENFDKLDSFVNLNKPDPNLFPVTSDAWNTVQVFCISKTDTISYSASFFNLLGQPFIMWKRDFGKGTVNLEINTIVAGILPKSSFLKREIEINSLTDKYIEWYIDRVLD